MYGVVVYGWPPLSAGPPFNPKQCHRQWGEVCFITLFLGSEFLNEENMLKDCENGKAVVLEEHLYVHMYTGRINTSPTSESIRIKTASNSSTASGILSPVFLLEF